MQSRPTIPRSVRSSVAALARLQRTEEFVTYCEQTPLGQKQPQRWLSIHSFPQRQRIVIAVTDRQETRVSHFLSRAEGVTVDTRRQGLPVLDMADAFALAEQISRQWQVLARPPRD